MELESHDNWTVLTTVSQLEATLANLVYVTLCTWEFGPSVIQGVMLKHNFLVESFHNASVRSEVSRMPWTPVATNYTTMAVSSLDGAQGASYGGSGRVKGNVEVDQGRGIKSDGKDLGIWHNLNAGCS